MTKNEAEKSLEIINLDERSMENFLQAKTEEEQAAILQESGVVPAGDNLSELTEEELSRVAGGNTYAESYNIMCQICGLRYYLLTKEQVLEKTREHTKATRHRGFVYFVRS